MDDIDLASLVDADVLDLTTTGRVSGQARTIEIWFTYYEGRLYLNAEHGHDTQWVRNILVQPFVHIRLQQHDFEGYGRVLDRQQDQALWHIVADLSNHPNSGVLPSWTWPANVTPPVTTAMTWLCMTSAPTCTKLLRVAVQRASRLDGFRAQSSGSRRRDES